MSRNSFGLLVALRAPSASRRELLQSLEELRARAVEGDPEGCVELAEDLGQPGRFVWIEWWPSREKVHEARASDRFRVLLAAVRTLGHLETLEEVDRRPVRPFSASTDREITDVGARVSDRSSKRSQP